MVVYALNENMVEDVVIGTKIIPVPVMTWNKAETVPDDAVPNFTYDLEDVRCAKIGNGTKEFFAISCGSCKTNGGIFAFVKADNLTDCLELLKKHYPILQSDGFDKRYVGIKVYELEVPETYIKCFDDYFYKI